MSSVRQTVGEGADVEKLLYEALIQGTRASNSFPGEGDDLGFLESIPAFQDKISNFRQRIVKMMVDMAANVDASDNLFNLDYLRNADASELSSFEPVSNVIELLLENVDSYLDDALNRGRGAAKESAAGHMSSSGSGNAQQVVVSKSELVRDVREGLHGVVTHANNIERPQSRFPQSTDNSRTPFKPLLTSKPHGRTPLNVVLIEGDASASAAHAKLLGVDSDRIMLARYAHPYESEIKAALASPPPWVYSKPIVGSIPSLESTPFSMVQTPEALAEMVEAIRKEPCVAVDLENHSYRSFQGFCCLIQISTRTRDFVVDALALRGDLQVLNVVFADPTIVKVLHGSDFDVQWLQRDFGVYLVSMFDTGQAARTLGYPSAALSHALFRHCKLKVNKAYQLADWRVRPLPDEMLKYAREDTHYLLHVFDVMRLELLEAGGAEAVFAVLRKSADIALVAYEKESFSPSSYKRLVQVKNLHLTPRQDSVLASVFAWRDAVARREDESLQYVLPDRMLIRIAQDIPNSASELERTCNPLPPVVQTRVTELLALVRSAASSAALEGTSAMKTNAVNSSVDQEIRALTGAGAPRPDGSYSLGLNASRASFIPINRLMPQKKADVSGAAGNRRGAILREERQSLRATPSPVLTTEQLYDTAGWQDIADPNWKAGVIARTSGAQRTFSAPGTANSQPMAESHKRAAATLALIGEEQVASALRPAQLVEDSAMSSDNDSEDQDVDEPDADALESRDIPRSMAEIYRISNRNRKRNKDKKKLKDDKGRDEDDAEDGGGDDEDSHRKKSKDDDQDMMDITGRDDAIDFMRGIGWVKGEQRPVATLLVEGAPAEAQRVERPAMTDVAGGGAEAHGSSSSSFSKNARGRKPTPASPKRKPGSNQQHTKPPQQQRPYGAAKAPFTYSQALGTAAGVRPPATNPPGRDASRQQPPAQGAPQQQPVQGAQQSTYQKRAPGAYVGSMTYRG